MPHVLFFTRNRCTSVEQVDERRVRAQCRLEDTLTEAFAEVSVRLPDLELIDVRGEVYRSAGTIPSRAAEALGKVIGTRIGPGMVKIMKGLVGEGEETEELLNMVDECCQAVVLAFTKDELAKAPREEKKAREFCSKLLKENARLYNSCIAFSPESPLVQGIKIC
jgi:class 3 adenylate cyclase